MSGGSRMYREHYEHIQEQQNDQGIAELESKVRKLRQITIDIREETKNQNKMLDGMV
jgi:hypothetical protein